MNATVTPIHRAVSPAPTLLPMNVHAYVHSILEAANSLLRNDLTVAAFDADGDTRKVALRVNDCPLLRRMAELGQASYDCSGRDEQGPYRVGVFYRCGVTVYWRERVPS